MKNKQILQDPLHNAEIVHHLHEGDEKDDGGQRVDEEPVLGDCVGIEEECSTVVGTLKEVGSKGGDPFEDGETSATLQHEESDGLLNKQTYNDGGPDDEIS